MDKKKAFLLTIALLITLIISALVVSLFSHTNKDALTNIDSISRQEAFEKKVAEILVKVLKGYDNVEDVIISTETNHKQVIIITKASYHLTPEVKEHIEKFINDVYPESTVNYSSD